MRLISLLLFDLYLLWLQLLKMPSNFLLKMKYKLILVVRGVLKIQRNSVYVEVLDKKINIVCMLKDVLKIKYINISL